jgi:hypothetical protein
MLRREDDGRKHRTIRWAYSEVYRRILEPIIADSGPDNCPKKDISSGLSTAITDLELCKTGGETNLLLLRT